MMWRVVSVFGDGVARTDPGLLEEKRVVDEVRVARRVGWGVVEADGLYVLVGKRSGYIIFIREDLTLTGAS